MEAAVDIGRDQNLRTRGVAANGASIRQARRLGGLTQEALATAAKCDEKTIRRAERSCRLDIATLLRIADALEVPYCSVVVLRPQEDRPDIEGSVLQPTDR
jgi:transcriptional regulator with XRE-family HTH domain